MNSDDVRALIGDERPAGWVQYHDGSWAPVWQDGRIGPSLTISQLINLAADDRELVAEPTREMPPPVPGDRLSSC